MTASERILARCDAYMPANVVVNQEYFEKEISRWKATTKERDDALN